MCAGSVASAQWTGPFDADQRIQYLNGRVLVGPGAPGNPRVRFDVVEPGTGTRDISFHAFAGTPLSGIRTTAIWGETNNPNGRALQGFNFATSGFGAGVWGESASPDGTGLRARATAATGATTAVWGDAGSPDGTAVYAQATSTTGPATAVWAITSSTDGFSGYFQGGRNFFQGNIGFGTENPTIAFDLGAFNTIGSSASTGAQVHDPANRGNKAQFGYLHAASGEFNGMRSSVVAGTNGTCGSTNNSGDIGFYTWECQTSTTREVVRINGRGNMGIGTAAPSSGNKLQVAGNISASTIDSGLKNFKIDHPLDPENKYLYHASIESDQAVNIYSGNITTDASGHATITMPEWCEALNEDFRYQLTIIDDGGTWAQARVAREMDLNSFLIQTSAPYIKVSWQVTGRRKDAFIMAHPMHVEVEKAAADRGKLLYPEAFGEPASRGIGYTAPEAPAKAAPVAASRTPAERPVAPSAPPRRTPVSNEPPLRPVQGGNAGR
jgi:hypothetical protein